LARFSTSFICVFNPSAPGAEMRRFLFDINDIKVWLDAPSKTQNDSTNDILIEWQKKIDCRWKRALNNSRYLLFCFSLIIRLNKFNFYKRAREYSNERLVDNCL
jgi:hypothetical protein